jgi:tRNA(Ser,Leu) C12 N-acetylase TAN1
MHFSRRDMAHLAKTAIIAKRDAELDLRKNPRRNLMRDWNVVVIVAQQRFKAACDLLQPLGPVKRTHFYNTVVMRVADLNAFLATLVEWMEKYPDTSETVVRIAPAKARFSFETAQDFEQKASEILSHSLPQLAGKSFHVRVHRRDRRSRFSGSAEERRLGEMLLDKLAARGVPGRAEFRDPDAIIDIETVDSDAGLSVWNREEMQKYPFLKLD